MGTYTADLYVAKNRAEARIKDILTFSPRVLNPVEQNMLQDILLCLSPDPNVGCADFGGVFQRGLIEQTLIGLGHCSEEDRYLAISLIKFFYAFTKVEYFLLTQAFLPDLTKQLMGVFFSYFIPVMRVNFYKIFWLFNEGAEDKLRFDHIPFYGDKADSIYRGMVGGSLERKCRTSLESMLREVGNPRNIRYRCALDSDEWTKPEFQHGCRQKFQRLANLWLMKEGVGSYRETVELMQLFLVLPIYDYRDTIPGFDNDALMVEFMKVLTCYYFKLLNQTYKDFEVS